MFNHLMLGATDIDASRKFYDAILGVLGASPGTADSKGRVIYKHDGDVLMLSKPIDGAPATGANGGTVGFACTSGDQAKQWHDAGVAAGGTSIEDPPGQRNPTLYLAYLRDPSGNKLCAVHKG